MSKNLVSFDWAMKKLLRSKANFGILEGFLSELLKQDVKILNLLESESNKDHKDDKQNRVDILVQVQNGEIVLVEVQVNNEYDYFYRILFGTSKIITEYLGKGDAYYKIKKVYSVNILYFDLGHGKDYVYHGTTNFIGIHAHDELDLSAKQKELYNKQCTSEIFPEYYLIKVNAFNDVAKDTLDEWIYFLKNEEVKDNFHAKGLAEVKEKLTEINLPESEKEEYKKYLEDLHYQASMVETNYHSGHLDGEKAGVKKGEKIGIEKGKAEGEKIGIEKGKAEGKIEIAKKMQNAGVSAELILQVTGIDIETLKIL